jgi:vancomycin resistance protein YoaR
MAGKPVTFFAGGRSWQIRPRTLGVTADWHAAVAEALDRSGGSGLFRGYHRLALRFSPIEVMPETRVYEAAVDYEVGVLGKAIDRPARDARLHRRGLRIVVAPSKAGTALDRAAAYGVIVDALASLERAPVKLPVVVDQPKVNADDLDDAAQLDRRIVSAPLAVVVGDEKRRLTRWQLASMLVLQKDASAKPLLGGRPADEFFGGLARAVDQAPRSATFSVTSSSVHVVPSQPGLALDVPHASAAVLAAAQHSAPRAARLSLEVAQPKRSTADAKAMGITGVVGSYETEYGGIANRIHNVQLVAHLIDGKLIAPGATFSFNHATGERTAAKGFLEAPVIINGELETGLGGGVCQVSTTVFNAAYEAGLPITARTNHALYISHYPLGRDATVDYPDIDLKFVNDTGHWMLLRTFVGSSSLYVSLYGAPQHRRVVTDTAPLTVVAPTPVVKSVDPTLAPGTQVVDQYGAPAQATSVHRLVYDSAGKLLSDSTWSSHYQSEPTIIRVGPKAKPKPKVKPKPKDEQPPAASTPGETPTTGTEPTQTTPTTPAETATGSAKPLP